MIVAATIYRWSLLWTYRWAFLHGLATALKVAVVALLISMVVGLLFAVWRMTPAPYCWPATIYINVFLGLPALVSIIWVYFGWSLALGITLSVFQACVIALVLLYSAYLAEIFRAALTAIHRGQREAGLALGLRRSHVFLLVVLPQAARIAIPNIGSSLIGMVKDTSVFMTIGLAEVVYVSENAVAATFQPFVFYTAAGVIYVVIAFVIDFVARILERTIGGQPSGRIPLMLTGRKRRRFTALAEAPMTRDREILVG
jgi:His/Glu/Gln/Arg/opine family amino acid ABC transporter permease subunit